MRRGKIPDDVYDELETNSRYTHTYCEMCSSEVRHVVSHPYKDDVFICESCEVDIYAKRENLDIDDGNEDKKED